MRAFSFALILLWAGLSSFVYSCNRGNGDGEDRPQDGDVVYDRDGAGEAKEKEVVLPQPFGAPCTADEQCEEGVCFQQICTRECSSYAMCPEEGFGCYESGDGRALCIAKDYEEGPGRMGWNCAIRGDADCVQAEGYICLRKTPDDPYAICTRPCTGDWQCPYGMICEPPVEGAVAYCEPRKFCDRCLFNDQCGYAGDLCIADAAGRKFCSVQCSVEGETCPVDSTCTDIGGGVFQCVPDREGGSCTGDGGLCSPCEVDANCLPGGKCIEDYYTRNKFCGVPCDDPACPAPIEYYCDTEIGQCRPKKGSCSQPSGGRLICDSCEGDADCYSGFCLPFPDEYNRVCGEDCTETRSCPSPWATCYEIVYADGTPSGYRNCLPKEGLRNCFQYFQCNNYCPDGPAGCELPYCS